MRFTIGNLLHVTDGVIVHQVNCQGAFGAGLAKQIAAMYPTAKADYLEYIRLNGKGEQCLGTVCYSHVSSTLTIAHAFGQNYYGNAYKTGKTYTDLSALVACLETVCRDNPGNDVFIPYRIGCGLGGESWCNVEHAIAHLPVTVVSLR